MGSELWKISKSDVTHGLLVAVATSVMTMLLQMLSANNVDWKQLGIAAVSTTMVYLLKVLSSTPDGKILGKV